MLEFTVQDMTCSHCAGVITKAVKTVDANATLEFDIARHSVKVSTAADAGTIAAAIREEGYTPIAAEAG
jgi:copper chaperone